jgi:hypothetical protein
MFKYIYIYIYIYINGCGLIVLFPLQKLETCHSCEMCGQSEMIFSNCYII